MKANDYKVIEMCVELGVDIGWNRAHKHDDKPGEEYIKSCICDAVEFQIAEYYHFNEIEE